VRPELKTTKNGIEGEKLLENFPCIHGRPRLARARFMGMETGAVESVDLSAKREERGPKKERDTKRC